MAIKLEKTGDTHKIDLTKRDNSAQKEIVINLNWSQGNQSGWSKFWSGDKSIDLDLGCWYELQNGTKSCIDGLQFAHGQGGNKNQVTRQGCYTQRPWIWHSGDDRSGSAGDGENILINPQGASELKRITVYTFIYDGVAKWAETNAVVTVKVPGNPDIIVEMGKQYSLEKFCAIAEILFDSNSMTVKKLVTFHNGHNGCDKQYGWGMQWRAGSK
ncbi:MAG: stress protein [Dysgonamonadaceae bacterium]|jgi:tellurite resistance protein TerA|nr:stress protein [Dysgonamonadaceae bacterium]